MIVPDTVEVKGLGQPMLSIHIIKGFAGLLASPLCRRSIDFRNCVLTTLPAIVLSAIAPLL
jgi:hypothetical protein